jgi:hypothetical protein
MGKFLEATERYGVNGAKLLNEAKEGKKVVQYKMKQGDVGVLMDLIDNAMGDNDAWREWMDNIVSSLKLKLSDEERRNDSYISNNLSEVLAKVLKDNLKDMVLTFKVEE